MPDVTTFDRLFAEGAPLIRQRLHHRESPPVEGGRWAVSVVLRGRLETSGRSPWTWSGSRWPPGSVMACAQPVDDHAARLMQRLGYELGDDAWREAGLERDIWYASILHFAADIAAPSELVEWVARRRDLDLGRTVTNTAELVRFHYEDGPAGRLMRPQALASARTGLENGFAGIQS